MLFPILVEDVLTDDGLLLPQQLPIAHLSLCCFSLNAECTLNKKTLFWVLANKVYYLTQIRFFLLGNSFYL